MVNSMRRRRSRKVKFKHTERALAGPAALWTTHQASVRMARVRQAGTHPELAVRRIARELGLRFTIKNPELPGAPDLANRRRRIAIFVHGCFWHQHRNCAGASIPATNRDFWSEKFRRNKNRDRRAMSELRKMGYTVAIVWECQIKNETKAKARLRQQLVKAANAVLATNRRRLSPAAQAQR
jgi:DNA mismatch endonuclease (patch repair protein)